MSVSILDPEYTMTLGKQGKEQSQLLPQNFACGARPHRLATISQLCGIDIPLLTRGIPVFRSIDQDPSASFISSTPNRRPE